MKDEYLSATDHVVLAVLAEAPSHGFALAQQLSSTSDLGRIFTVRRPLVYRALNRLVEHDLATPGRREPSTAGPQRRIHIASPNGRRINTDWLSEPVRHVRDVRTQLLVKLRLLDRSELSNEQLVHSQRLELNETLEQLIARGATGDAVDQWRMHSATATLRFLNSL